MRSRRIVRRRGLFTLTRVSSYVRLPLGERLWHGVFVLTTLTIVVIGSRFCHWYWSDSPGDNARSRAAAALSASTELLFVGTSRVERDIRPNLFSLETMTLSAHGLDFVAMRAVLDEALVRAPETSLVVVELAPLSLRFDHVYWFGTEQLEQLGVAPGELDLTLLDELHTYIVPLRERRFTPSRLSTKRLSPDEPRVVTAGYVASDRIVRPGDTAARVEFFEDVMVADLGERQRALIEIVRSLDRRGIRVKLLRFPLHEAFRAESEKRWGGDVEQTVERVVTETHLSRDDVWDFSALDIFETTDFADADHLNASGASKLSRWLDLMIGSGASATDQ